jgi:hypothetical protein
MLINLRRKYYQLARARARGRARDREALLSPTDCSTTSKQAWRRMEMLCLCWIDVHAALSAPIEDDRATMCCTRTCDVWSHRKRRAPLTVRLIDLPYPTQ